MAGITGRNDILLLFDEFGVLNHLPCLSTEENLLKPCKNVRICREMPRNICFLDCETKFSE